MNKYFIERCKIEVTELMHSDRERVQKISDNKNLRKILLQGDTLQNKYATNDENKLQKLSRIYQHKVCSCEERKNKRLEREGGGTTTSDSEVALIEISAIVKYNRCRVSDS